VSTGACVAVVEYTNQTSNPIQDSLNSDHFQLLDRHLDVFCSPIWREETNLLGRSSDSHIILLLRFHGLRSCSDIPRDDPLPSPLLSPTLIGRTSLR
jgi:hypothetical protein